MDLTERGFVLLAAVVLVAVVVGAVAADGSSTGDRVSFEPDVPDVQSFEPTEDDGVATVDGDSYDSVQAAVDAAEPGDTVTLEGRFEETVTVRTPGVTITSADDFAVVDGEDHAIDETDGASDEAADGVADGTADDVRVGDVVDAEDDGPSEGTVVTIDAANVTLDGVWVRNSGFSATDQDAGIWVTDEGTDVAIVDSRITDVTFGVWLHEVRGATLEDNVIVGHEDVYPEALRGNGIHLFHTEAVVMEGNSITQVRDGIYFSYAAESHALENTMWNLRFGVHYMFSDDCVLDGNVSFDNDVGFALMVSKNLEIVNNKAVSNAGPSGHGLQVLQIEDTVIAGNELVDNRHGIHMDNSQRIELTDNLVMENVRGAHVTSGTRNEHVANNSFVNNDRQAFTPMTEQKQWDGNHWSDARSADLTGDGVSEVRHRPEGAVENIVYSNPEAAVFANSPAFDAVRMAESSFPIIESPGVVDNRPLVDSPTDWRNYYGR